MLIKKSTRIQVQKIINKANKDAASCCCGNCFFYFGPTRTCKLLVDKEGNKIYNTGSDKNGFMMVGQSFLCEHWSKIPPNSKGVRKYV